MKKTVRDILNSRSEDTTGSHTVGLERLSRCLQDDGPIVVWLHGSVGAGKSELFDAFTTSAPAANTHVIRIDCRTVEPTVAGFLDEVGKIPGAVSEDLERAASSLSDLGTRVIIALDNYQVFRLADSWLRRDFIPALSASARVVLISREPPTAGWISATEWRDFFITIELESLTKQEPAELILRVREEAQQAELRRALEAVSVVRRVTRPVLNALCPDLQSDEVYEQISRLSFVDSVRDGLAIKDSYRKAISNHLQAADVERYRQYQQGAWKLLRQQLKDSSRADLWRCTSDFIYLIQNPVIREAFFPSESAQFSVEPALPADKQDVMDIAERHETAAALDVLELWWSNLPTAFHVVKDTAGTIVGFYCMAKPDQLGGAWMQHDPVSRNWQSHVNLNGKSARVPSIFLRRWLSRVEGEGPSPIQAAAWIDIKRSYLELRPDLRRVYLTLQDIGPYGPAATELGFRVLENVAASLNGNVYHTAMMDFGPGSVDGWICRLLGAELGITDDQMVDGVTRELVLQDKRIPLTPLEFSLISMLESRAGEAVPRNELLQQVWGHDYDGGSNVVDAAVLGLRKKCGESAHILETVRGVGYRLRVQESQI